MTRQEFVQYATEQLRVLLHHSGKVLYSAGSTLRPGELYLLGMNPGGDPAHPASHTVCQSLERLSTKATNDYLDEQWTNRKGAYSAGKHPLQQRIQRIMDDLGYDLRDVCASNLIFTRSPAAVGAEYPRNASICWPLHEKILSIVQPRSILVFGNSACSPFQFLLERAQAESPESPISVRTISSGHGNWKCKSFHAPLGGAHRNVVGLPHLSRYSPEGKPHVMGWLRKQLVA